ncbi:MAG TPA: hypothetical protein VFQ61_16000 [Polyangiaceae bacterium]|nr:hypothetical protein [Polyangiaceae bacterium]
MAKNHSLLQRLQLRGLELAPPQVWGGIRLVPLLRREVREDLRLFRRTYDEPVGVVGLEGDALGPGLKYVSYIPHGLIVSWSDDGAPCAAFGAQLMADGKRLGGSAGGVRVLHRMARRESANRLRLLPLHLAMEGFLALHFGGPELAWTEYSNYALSRGLDPRSELTFAGMWIPGLEAALRVFEIHENQAGLILFIGESLASIFVVPHPSDYRALHRTLLEDFFGEQLLYHGLYAAPAQVTASMDDSRVGSLLDLRRELEILNAGWRDFHALLAAGLLGVAIHSERVYRAGPFQLQRFSTPLDPATENHIGEAIVRDSGALEYMKTYRLSAAQTRRAYLLSQLAAHDWHLERTAGALRQTKEELVQRLDKAGFGYLLRDHVLEAARRRR